MVPQLDPSFYSSQLFWLFICFGFLVFSFKKYFIPRMDRIISQRSQHIDAYSSEIKKIEDEINRLENMINNIKGEELRETSEIIRKAVKKSETILSEQLEIMKLENEGLINGTRKRINDEIKSVDSIFKIQIDITSQILFEKLFLQRL